MNSQSKSRGISYYLDLQEEDGMVIFGYFFNNYFTMIDEKEVLIDRVIDFCERNNKDIDYNILINDYSQYELQIKVINKDAH